MGLKTYLLIRVGLDVGREEWFGRKLEIEGREEGREDVSRSVEDGRVSEEGHAGGTHRLTESRHSVGEKHVAETSQPSKNLHPVGKNPAEESGSLERNVYPAEGKRLVEFALMERNAYPAEGKRAAEFGLVKRSAYPTGGKRVAEFSPLERSACPVEGLPHPLRTLWQRRRDRQKAKRERKLRAARDQERERRLAVRARAMEEVEGAIGRLAKEIEEFADGLRDCYYVYEDSLRRVLLPREESSARNREPDVLVEEALLPLLWQKHFQGEAFRGYGQRFWVEQLLPQAVHPHFVILGTAPCLFDVIEKWAGRMKSLRWILEETDCDEELLGFVEDFCTEYGLAIMLEPLQGAVALKRLRLTCLQPVNVLDFTGEAYMGASDIPKGSVWLDMFSVEEKQRRIMARYTGITYVSLKEKWKTVQRRCVCPKLP